jgi:hypothetical protein
MPQPSLRGFWQLLAVAVICHVAAGGGWWKRWAPRLPAPVWGFGYALGLVAVLVTAPQVERVFIYFQF